MAARKVILVLILSLLLGAFGAARADGPKSLPRRSLLDPRGASHALDALTAGGRGVILVVTAPTVDQERAQRGWDEALVAARPADAAARVVFLEDLSQSWFKSVARAAMKKDFVPDREPLLLVDEDGATREALGVGKAATVVLVFDKAGALVATHTEAPSRPVAARVWAEAAR